MTEALKNIYIALFGTTELWGLNIGFWILMIIVAVLVFIMNIVFWSFKPKESRENKDEKRE